MAEGDYRFSVDKNDRKLVERIEDENYLNFKDRTRKEQFLLTMAIGVNSNLARRPLSAKDPWFHEKDLSDEDIALLAACAIKDTGSIEVITDLEKIYRIAEEYAHIGLKILVDKIDANALGTFEKQFESEVTELFNQIFV